MASSPDAQGTAVGSATNDLHLNETLTLDVIATANVAGNNRDWNNRMQSRQQYNGNLAGISPATKKVDVEAAVMTINSVTLNGGSSVTDRARSVDHSLRDRDAGVGRQLERHRLAAHLRLGPVRPEEQLL